MADRKCRTEGAVPPKLHPPVDQGQGNEVLLAVLAVVEQNAGGLGGPELHCDAHGVVGTHGLEGQVGLAAEGRDEVLDDCRGRRQALSGRRAFCFPVRLQPGRKKEAFVFLSCFSFFFFARQLSLLSSIFSSRGPP